MSKPHEHDFVPVVDAIVDFDATDIQSTKETACALCGKRGPDNPEQEIFPIELPSPEPRDG